MDPQQQNQPPQQPSVNPQYAPTGGTLEQPQQFTPASSPTEPPQGKKIGLIIAGVVVVVIILGVVAFALLGSDKKDDNKKSTNNSSSSSSETSAPANDNLQKYSVTDKPTGITFSVSFFKGAAVEEKKGRTFLTAGEEGSLKSVYLGAATGDKIDCGDSPTETMKLAGESTTVCYASGKTQFAGYAKTKSGMVKVNVAGQKALNLDDVKDVMESIAF